MHSGKNFLAEERADLRLNRRDPALPCQAGIWPRGWFILRWHFLLVLFTRCMLSFRACGRFPSPNRGFATQAGEPLHKQRVIRLSKPISSLELLNEREPEELEHARWVFAGPCTYVGSANRIEEIRLPIQLPQVFF